MQMDPLIPHHIDLPALLLQLAGHNGGFRQSKSLVIFQPIWNGMAESVRQAGVQRGSVLPAWKTKQNPAASHASQFIDGLSTFPRRQVFQKITGNHDWKPTVFARKRQATCLHRLMNWPALEADIHTGHPPVPEHPQALRTAADLQHALVRMRPEQLEYRRVPDGPVDHGYRVGKPRYNWCMGLSRKEIGRWGEERAAAYLGRKQYQILARNVRTEHGEIDIVARHGLTLVFVEVKTRTSDKFGPPENSITAQKQAHMIHSADAFLLEHPELEALEWRIDVIAVLKDSGEREKIDHFENAIHG